MENSLDRLAKGIDEKLSKKVIALLLLKSKGFRVIIPEIRVGDKAAYGIALEDDKAYVVYPNGLEEEIKKIFKVKEVKTITLR